MLARLSEVIRDAEDDRVVYSPSYWRAVEVYVDYLRIEDPRKLQGRGDPDIRERGEVGNVFPERCGEG